MDKLQLKPKAALGGWTAQSDGVSVTELTDFSLVSIAAPKDGQDALKKAVSKGASLELPTTGRSVASKNLNLLGLQPDQWFLVLDEAKLDPVAEVRKQLGDNGHLTDQSDSWVAIQIGGADVRTVLERICPIDLDRDAFPLGSVTRTSMEHLGVIITRTGDDEFLMLSARSSAESFKHAVELSIKNTRT